MSEGWDSFTRGEPRSRRTKYLDRAERTLDLSRVAPAQIKRVRFEVGIQLNEVLDRIELPLEADIPNTASVEAEGLTSWRIPHTEVDIVQVREGPRKGEFLFSADTLARADEFYARVKDVPKRPGATTPVDVYQLYLGGYGGLLPTWVVTAIPAWAKSTVFGQGIWKWLGLVAYLIMVLILCVLAIRARPELGGTDSTVANTIRRLLLPAVVILAALGLDVLLGSFLHFTGVAGQALEVVGRIAFLFAGIYILHLFVEWLANASIAGMRTRSSSIDTQLIRLALRILFWVAMLAVVMFMAEEIGLPVAAVAASIGVGGLAVALAAQSTLENLVAGLTILGDRPVRIGDYCRVGETAGTIEEIGLRSTRLRTLDRTLVTIPNSDVAKQRLENYTRRDHILLKPVLGLRYETTAEQLRFMLGRLRELFHAHPMVVKDGARVRFVGFGAFSLDLEVFVYIRTNQYPTFLAVREDILLRVIDIVEAAGTGFAFPSQTTYLARDGGLDSARTEAAEAAVAEWRAAGDLPFPELESARRSATKDSLDYPPDGSAERGTRR